MLSYVWLFVWKKVAAQWIIVVGYWDISLTGNSFFILSGRLILADAVGFSHLGCPASEHFFVGAEAQRGTDVFYPHWLVGRDWTKMQLWLVRNCWALFWRRWQKRQERLDFINGSYARLKRLMQRWTSRATESSSVGAWGHVVCGDGTGPWLFLVPVSISCADFSSMYIQSLNISMPSYKFPSSLCWPELISVVWPRRTTNVSVFK